MILHVVTPAAGKRLIGRALARHPALDAALADGTVIVVAGTTNGYVAEELLGRLGQAEGFSRRRFFRGVTIPAPRVEAGERPSETECPGDVVIRKGQWEPGRTIFDVVDDLQEGDVILKGANALDLAAWRAAILVGHPKAGTIGAALTAVVGRRVRLILPVGLEKRVAADLDELAAQLNAPGVTGPRLLPVPGEIFTELEAIALLSGAEAELVAGGGVAGAEGAVWLAIDGTDEQVAAADALLREVAAEPAFDL